MIILIIESRCFTEYLEAEGELDILKKLSDEEVSLEVERDENLKEQ